MHKSSANELKTPLLMESESNSESGSVHGASLASAASSTNSVAPLLPPESSAAAARERAERLRRRSPPPGVELVNAAPAADGGDDESDGDDGAPPLDLGKLVVSLATPLLVTFLLVLYLDAALAEGTSGMRGALSGMMVYTEDAADDAATIAWGVAENAGAVALWICMVTWLMYCLYKHRCYRVIYGWLVLSVAMLLGGTGGWVARLLLEKYEIPLDWPSACAAAAAQIVASRPRAQFSQVRRRRAAARRARRYFLLWNFSAVGTITVFWSSPILGLGKEAPVWLARCYMVVVSALLGWSLTKLPEWTTWAVLIALAFWDVLAVGCASGPLRKMVDLAQERDEPIPGLIYPGEGIQLGLGDFIFYSMLVGRAAMSGTAAFVCCTIAVLSGLGGTLALLALTRHALPALPISIALGAVVYFTTTAAVSPFARAALGHGLVV